MMKIPMMTYIKITWANGCTTKLLPYILAEGQSRVVLCGTDVSTQAEASVVLKIQHWRWHSLSNEHEADIANNRLNFCTPAFYGVHKVSYVDYDLSVSVVEKVARTMENNIRTLFASPLNSSAVYQVFQWVRCVFPTTLRCVGTRFECIPSFSRPVLPPASRALLKHIYLHTHIHLHIHIPLHILHNATRVGRNPMLTR